MSSMTLFNGSSLQDTHDWLKTSVQTFFATCNWDNRSAEVQEVAIASLLQEESVPLTLDLRVGQFFAAVNWDGISLAPQAASALPEAADLTAESLDELEFGGQPKETFTLTDFSDLF